MVSNDTTQSVITVIFTMIVSIPLKSGHGVKLNKGGKDEKIYSCRLNPLEVGSWCQTYVKIDGKWFMIKGVSIPLKSGHGVKHM